MSASVGISNCALYRRGTEGCRKVLLSSPSCAWLPLLHPLCTSSVPFLYPLCTLSVPFLYPAVPPTIGVVVEEVELNNRMVAVVVEVVEEANNRIVEEEVGRCKADLRPMGHRRDVGPMWGRCEVEL